MRRAKAKPVGRIAPSAHIQILKAVVVYIAGYRPGAVRIRQRRARRRAHIAECEIGVVAVQHIRAARLSGDVEVQIAVAVVVEYRHAGAVVPYPKAVLERSRRYVGEGRNV